MYRTEQSTTTPYNMHGHVPIERLNCTLIGLFKSLPKEKKSNWPLHLPLLVFAYNARPHDATGYCYIIFLKFEYDTTEEINND